MTVVGGRASLAGTSYSPLVFTHRRYEDSQDQQVLRLPWDAPLLGDDELSHQRKLLKLHGCVTHPESIVLTREDYLRYGDDREALRGLVSRSLIEKELLIIGFSMSDDNLHIAIDQCRKVWGDPAAATATIESNAKSPHRRRKSIDKRACTSGRVSYQRDDAPKKMGTIVTLEVNSMFTQLCARSRLNPTARLSGCGHVPDLPISPDRARTRRRSPHVARSSS